MVELVEMVGGVEAGYLFEKIELVEMAKLDKIVGWFGLVGMIEIIEHLFLWLYGLSGLNFFIWLGLNLIELS